MIFNEHLSYVSKKSHSNAFNAQVNIPLVDMSNNGQTFLVKELNTSEIKRIKSYYNIELNNQSVNNCFEIKFNSKSISNKSNLLIICEHNIEVLAWINLLNSFIAKNLLIQHQQSLMEANNEYDDDLSYDIPCENEFSLSSMLLLDDEDEKEGHFNKKIKTQTQCLPIKMLFPRFCIKKSRNFE